VPGDNVKLTGIRGMTASYSSVEYRFREYLKLTGIGGVGRPGPIGVGAEGPGRGVRAVT
jgi:hypothetical protein